MSIHYIDRLSIPLDDLKKEFIIVEIGFPPGGPQSYMKISQMHYYVA